MRMVKCEEKHLAEVKRILDEGYGIKHKPDYLRKFFGKFFYAAIEDDNPCMGEIIVGSVLVRVHS
jgi:hypothetical protein